MRDKFSQRTKDTLARRVGMRCSNPKCRRPTAGPSDTPTETLNIGVAAHITAASPGGPRYEKQYTAEERTAIQNGIWLCQNCAKLVDSDPRHYTTDLLLRWKSISEQVAHSALASSAPPVSSRSVDELITLTEIRAAAVIDVMDDLAQKAISAYRSERTSERPVEKEDLSTLIERAHSAQDTAALHRFPRDSISGCRQSRWAKHENEASLLAELEELKQKFVDLHARHKNELGNGNFVAAHELVGEIHSLIAKYNRASDPPYPRFDKIVLYQRIGTSLEDFARRATEQHARYPGMLTAGMLVDLPTACGQFWLLEGEESENLKKAMAWENERMQKLLESMREIITRKLDGI